MCAKWLSGLCIYFVLDILKFWLQKYKLAMLQPAECYIFLQFIKTVLLLNLVFLSTLQLWSMFITFYVFDSGFLLNCTSTEIFLKVL